MPSDASMILQHLYLGAVYKPDGKAVLNLMASMEVKYNIPANRTAAALDWCRKKDLVKVEETKDGITRLEVTAKYKIARMASR